MLLQVRESTWAPGPHLLNFNRLPDPTLAFIVFCVDDCVDDWKVQAAIFPFTMISHGIFVDFLVRLFFYCSGLSVLPSPSHFFHPPRPPDACFSA